MFHISLSLPPTMLTLTGAVRRLKQPAKTFSMSFTFSQYLSVPFAFSTESMGAEVSLNEKRINLL